LPTQGVCSCGGIAARSLSDPGADDVELDATVESQAAPSFAAFVIGVATAMIVSGLMRSSAVPTAH
jgi:hypothetical protein